MLYFVWQCTVM